MVPLMTRHIRRPCHMDALPGPLVPPGPGVLTQPIVYPPPYFWLQSTHIPPHLSVDPMNWVHQHRLWSRYLHRI